MKVVKKYGLDIKDVMNWTEENVNELYNIILEKHTLDIGITYCKFCHENQDPYRRATKRKE